METLDLVGDLISALREDTQRCRDEIQLLREKVHAESAAKTNLERIVADLEETVDKLEKIKWDRPKVIDIAKDSFWKAVGLGAIAYFVGAFDTLKDFFER